MPNQRISMRTRVIVSAMCVAALAAGCAGSPGFLHGRKPALRIGVTPNYPPIVYRDEAGLQGVEIELGEMAARALGRRPEFVELAWSELIPSLERGEIDVVMSGMSVTPARAERVLFTQPYMRVGQLSLIRVADVGTLGQPAAIHRRGARVGYVKGTTGEDYVRNSLVASESYAFDDVDAGVRSLRAERIDFFIHDAPTIWRVAMEPGGSELIGLYRPLTHEVLAWAVARDDSVLAGQLDALIDEWRASNRLEPILNRWIPVRVRIGS